MTTHDLSLASEEPLATAAELVHFSEIVSDNGEMRFDYRLRPGIATSRNALRLMKLIGIDREMTASGSSRRAASRGRRAAVRRPDRRR